MYPRKTTFIFLILLSSPAFSQSYLEIKSKVSLNSQGDSIVQIEELLHNGWQEISKCTGIPQDTLTKKPTVLNITPSILETYILRKKVINSLCYELLSEDNNFFKIILKNMDTLGYHFTGQFAGSPNGYFEDFDNGKELNIVLGTAVPNETHTLYIRGIDKIRNCTTNNLIFKVKNKTTILNDFRQAGLGHWAIILMFPLLVLVYYYFRTRLLKKEAEMNEKFRLQEQRNELTSDLHDDIGATLSSLSINCSIVNRLLNNDKEKAFFLLNKIESQSQELSEKLGDFIWSINSNETENFMNLGIRIKQFVNNLLEATDIFYKIEIDPKIDEIQDAKLKKYVVLIVKEAVNNIGKYSKASKAFINLEIIGERLSIQIKDDGVGFSPEKATGNGLKNIKSRVAILKGEIEFLSEINKGSNILIRIPI